MPEIRYYTVTQEREVRVSASSPLEAAQLATAAFAGEIQTDDIAKINVITPVRERSIDVREDY